MDEKRNTRRVVTFLTREEIDFLDKLEKDAIFSSGKYISRSQIIQDLAELLARTEMNAVGVKDDQELKERMIEAIGKLNKREHPEAANQAQEPEKKQNPGNNEASHE